MLQRTLEEGRRKGEEEKEEEGKNKKGREKGREPKKGSDWEVESLLDNELGWDTDLVIPFISGN